MSSTADSAHATAQQLLPWLLAGTLEGAELAMVRQHLQACPDCQADVARERRLRAAGQGEPALDPDMALARLLPRLEPHQPRQPRAALIERWRTAVAVNDSRWLHALAGAQFAAIAVLALLLARPDGGAAYRGMGATAQAQGNLVVAFRPDTPERELRRILQASGARVVDGPTVTDAYVLAVAPAHARRAAERLRAEPAVTLAQPLTPESRP